jgi:inhibitor of cysteine peptidase
MQDLGPDSDGQELRIAVGEQFAVTLPETPTTGFRWRMASPPDILTIVNDEFTPPDSARPGAGGVHRWVFHARASGSAMLRLELAAAGRRAADPRSFAMRIEIREG